MKQLLKYIPSLVVAVLIAYLSLRTKPFEHYPSFLLFPNSDKVIHALMYLTLSVSLFIPSGKNWLPATVTIVISTIYGGIIELLQHYYFPPRTGDWYDLLADFIGSFVGVSIVFLYRFFRR